MYFNLFTLSLHPFAIIIVFSQLFFLFIIYFNRKNYNKKKYIIFFLNYTFLCFLWFIESRIHFIKIRSDPMLHNRLTLKFFIGYNFKSFFNSYILGAINLL